MVATANDSRSSRSDQEGLLRRCIESAPVAIAMYDREMRYIATSRVYRELMGISATDPTGRCLYDVIHDFPRDWREIHQRCLSGASETCEAERHVRPPARLRGIDGVSNTGDKPMILSAAWSFTFRTLPKNAPNDSLLMLP